MNTNLDFSRFKDMMKWKRAAAFFLSMALLLTGIAIPDFPLYGSMTAHASASGDARGEYYKQPSFPISYLEQEDIHTITAEGKLGSISSITWYQFTPTDTADYAFWGSRQDNADLDTFGSVYTKNTELGYYEQLDFDDDSGSNGQFKIRTTLSAGTTYYLCAGYDDSAMTEEYEPVFCRSYITDINSKINGVWTDYVSTKAGSSYRLEAIAHCQGDVVPTYEWYTFDKDGNKNILPAIGNTYTYTQPDTAVGETQICCAVKTGTETETIVFSMFYTPVKIQYISVNGKHQSWCYFQMNRTYTLQAEAFSATGNALTYTWKIGDMVLQTGKDNVLSFTPTKELLQYDIAFGLTCEISDTKGCKDSSSISFSQRPIDASLEVNGKHTYNHINVFKGISYTLKANGITEPGKTLTYQWQNADGSVIGSGQTYQYTMGNDIDEETIYCVISNGSETCAFNFNLYHKPIANTTLTVNGTVMSGNAIPVHIGESYHFKVSAVSEPSAKLSYQWGTMENDKFFPIADQIGDTFSCKIVTAADIIPGLVCLISDDNGNTVQQNSYMKHTPIYDIKCSINGIPGTNMTTRNGQKYNLTVSASSESGKPLTYSWYIGDNNVSNTNTYAYTAADKNESIICVISDGTDSSETTFYMPYLDLSSFDFTINGVPTHVAYAHEGEKVTLEILDKTGTAGGFFWHLTSGDYLGNKKSITITMGKEAVEGNCSWNGGMEESYFMLLPVSEQTSPPCTSHTYVSKLTKAATASADGTITNTCSKCGHTQTSAIPKISDIKLAKTSLDYNGKKQSIALTVQDRTGKQLRAGTDYDFTLNGKKADTVSAKDVGKYTVKVTFKGNYSGSKDLSFTMLPKKTSLSKVSATKKGFKAAWKKQKAQVTGYELCYSTNKKFQKKATKIVTIKSYKTTSKTIKKLKAKTKYYVKIRTYKNVKVGRKTVKLYSKWSAVKNIKTK